MRPDIAFIVTLVERAVKEKPFDKETYRRAKKETGLSSRLLPPRQSVNYLLGPSISDLGYSCRNLSFHVSVAAFLQLRLVGHLVETTVHTIQG